MKRCLFIAIAVLCLMLTACEEEKVKWGASGDEFLISASSKTECQEIYSRFVKTLNSSGRTVNPTHPCGTYWDNEAAARANVSPSVEVTGIKRDNFSRAYEATDDRLLSECNEEMGKDLKVLAQKNATIFSIQRCSVRIGGHAEGQIAADRSPLPGW